MGASSICNFSSSVGQLREEREVCLRLDMTTQGSRLINGVGWERMLSEDALKTEFIYSTVMLTSNRALVSGAY